MTAHGHASAAVHPPPALHAPSSSTPLWSLTSAHPALPRAPRFYGQVFPPSGRDDVAILDMCSSWISHYPKGYKAGKVVGESHGGGGRTGMGYVAHRHMILLGGGQGGG